VRFQTIVAVTCVLCAALLQAACTGDCPPDSSGSLFCGAGAGPDASVEPPTDEPSFPEPNPCEDRQSGEVCDGEIRCSDAGECTCGDGTVDPGEECDDDSPGCDDTCHFVCSDEVPCPGETECREASVCSDSNVCQPGAPKTEGTPCTDGFCDDMGNCLGCDKAGDECALPNRCLLGEIACADGVATCVEAGPKPSGAPCGEGSICDGRGACVGCDDAGQECDNGDECVVGVIQCDNDAPECVDGDALPPGEVCGPSQVCNIDGECSECDETPGDELCDGRDNDCDGFTDEELAPPLCEEQLGVCSGSVQRCGGALGWLACGAEDWPATYEPDEATCDGLDNDCDGSPDEACECVVGDTRDCGSDVGECRIGEQTCVPEGWGECEGSVDPVDEVCDGLDNDCNGETDDEATDAPTWYEDSDGDGAGNAASSVRECAQPSGYVDDDTDCDDTEARRRPGLPEVCDGLDNDCNAVVDDDATDAATWFEDSDGDGFGNPSVSTESCGQPMGFVRNSDDCDDTTAQRAPGLPEVCDGLDNDCNLVVDDGATDAATWHRDADGDGFGDASATQAACARPEGYVADNTDCDDTTALRNPGLSEICDGLDNDCNLVIDDGATDAATWFRDADGDDFGDASSPLAQCTRPQGYVADNTDCDDTTALRNPGRSEVCDGLDNDCNVLVDDGASDAVTWYRDGDGDSYGDAADSIVQCEQPDGYVTDGTDCDDATAARNPGLEEVCDGIDNDCNILVDDDATDARAWFRDNDRDNFGDPNVSVVECEQPEGFVGDNTDCDDTRADRNPGLSEVCDGIDNNCNLIVDDDASDASTWYRDADGDTFGDASARIASCERPAGYVVDNTDCDDTSARRYPGLAEVCDGLDNDCNQIVDDGATDAIIWFQDVDGDGFGNPTVSVQQCGQPTGYVTNNTDCDDTRADRNPGLAEICDGVDNDCNLVIDDDATDAGTWYRDADGDGAGSPRNPIVQCGRPDGYVDNGTDCDDRTAARRPGLPEICDGIDNNCNLTIDENATDASTWYRDSDGDGAGDRNSPTRECERPLGYVENDIDCDDSRADRRPGLAETCDGIDNNCNNVIDENATDATTWYRDADGDTYGNPSNTRRQCTRPGGFVNRAGDCDDSTGDRRPGLAEVCDGLDNDCNANTREFCPRECKPETFRGRRYLFCDGDTNWTTARDTCAAQRMRLARVDDAAENNWMRSTATRLNRDSDSFWIGANDRGSENRWVWIDGTQFWQGRGNGSAVGGRYNRWNGGEPNDSRGEDCAEMLGNGTWNDSDCGDRREFTCERY